MWPDLYSTCGSGKKAGKGMITQQRHCAKNLKQIFPEIKLRGLVHNSYIHVSVSDLYISTISGCSQIGEPIVGIYKLLTYTRMWKLERRPRSFLSVLGIFFPDFRYSIITAHFFLWSRPQGRLVRRLELYSGDIQYSTVYVLHIP